MALMNAYRDENWLFNWLSEQYVCTAIFWDSFCYFFLFFFNFRFDFGLIVSEGIKGAFVFLSAQCAYAYDYSLRRR